MFIEPKHYLTPTTEEIGGKAVKWIWKHLKDTHKMVLSGKDLERKHKAIFFQKIDAKLENTPTLVAHLDTVNEYNVAPTEDDIVQTATQVSLKPTSQSKCLGADDRAGLALIVELVKNLAKQKEGINFNILLTYGEEIGCLGTKQFITENEAWFKAPFMLEFDRRGGDLVAYNTNNKEFVDAVAEFFNRKTGHGSTSDIKHFQDRLKINSVNIGVGFKSEHTKNETWDLVQWRATFLDLYDLMVSPQSIKELSKFHWKEAPKWEPDPNWWKDTIGQAPKTTISLEKIFQQFGRQLDQYLDEREEALIDKMCGYY